jgi:hypothetical protein
MNLVNIIKSVGNFILLPFHPNQWKPSNSFKTFTIRKGNHYCNEMKFISIRTKALSFRVIFNDTAIYKIPDYNQQDINKLLGLTDNGQFNDHKYSARFGWAYFNNELHLSAYVYNIGIREVKELCTIPLNQEVLLSIAVFENIYVFCVNGAQYEMPRLSHGEYARGCLLNFYFGGTQTAPHDMHLQMRSL